MKSKRLTESTWYVSYVVNNDRTDKKDWCYNTIVESSTQSTPKYSRIVDQIINSNDKVSSLKDFEIVSISRCST